MSDNDDCRLRRICKAYVSKLYSTALGHLFVGLFILVNRRLHHWVWRPLRSRIILSVSLIFPCQRAGRSPTGRATWKSTKQIADELRKADVPYTSVRSIARQPALAIGIDELSRNASWAGDAASFTPPSRGRDSPTGCRSIRNRAAASPHIA